MKKLLIILLLVPVFINGQNLFLTNGAGKVLSFGNLGITTLDCTADGAGMTFNGVDQYAYVSDNGDLDMAAASTFFVFGGYITTGDDISTAQYCIRKGNVGTTPGRYDFEIYNGILYLLFHPSGGVKIIADNITLATNTEYHVVCKIDMQNSRAYYYIDNVLQNSGGTSFTGTFPNMADDHKFSLGAQLSSAGLPSLPFSGSLRDVRVYHKDITDDIPKWMLNEKLNDEVAWWNLPEYTGFCRTDYDLTSFGVRAKVDYGSYTIETLLEPDGTSIHVQFQRDAMGFASKTDTIMWSTDNFYTFNKVAFDDADSITYSYIFSNGNVLFATIKNELWLGKNGLATVTQKYLQNNDGSPFIFHTPVNAKYPGIYFNTLVYNEPTYQDGVEMLVFCNYSMYSMAQQNGAVPPIVYETVDYGETVKVAYEFGKIPTGSGWYHQRDDGTATGGVTGTPLGNDTNSLYVAHNHYVTFDKYTNEWFISTGETGIMVKGTYNAITESWTWNQMLNVQNYMYRSAGMIVTPTHYYILSDNTLDVNYLGVWKFLKSELDDYTKGVQVYDIEEPLAPAIIYGNTTIAAHFNNGMHATVSLDSGVTWNTYNNLPLNIPSSSTNVLRIIGYPNSDGDFVVTPYNWSTELPYKKLSYLIKFK